MYFAGQILGCFIAPLIVFSNPKHQVDAAGDFLTLEEQNQIYKLYNDCERKVEKPLWEGAIPLKNGKPVVNSYEQNQCFFCDAFVSFCKEKVKTWCKSWAAAMVNKYYEKPSKYCKEFMECFTDAIEKDQKTKDKPLSKMLDNFVEEGSKPTIASVSLNLSKNLYPSTILFVKQKFDKDPKTYVELATIIKCKLKELQNGRNKKAHTLQDDDGPVLSEVYNRCALKVASKNAGHPVDPFVAQDTDDYTKDVVLPLVELYKAPPSDAKPDTKGSELYEARCYEFSWYRDYVNEKPCAAGNLACENALCKEIRVCFETNVLSLNKEADETLVANDYSELVNKFELFYNNLGTRQMRLMKTMYRLMQDDIEEASVRFSDAEIKAVTGLYAKCADFKMDAVEADNVHDDCHACGIVTKIESWFTFRKEKCDDLDTCFTKDLGTMLSKDTPDGLDAEGRKKLKEKIDKKYTGRFGKELLKQRVHCFLQEKREQLRYWQRTLTEEELSVLVQQYKHLCPEAVGTVNGKPDPDNEEKKLKEQIKQCTPCSWQERSKRSFGIMLGKEESEMCKRSLNCFDLSIVKAKLDLDIVKSMLVNKDMPQTDDPSDTTWAVFESAVKKMKLMTNDNTDFEEVRRLQRRLHCHMQERLNEERQLSIPEKTHLKLLHERCVAETVISLSQTSDVGGMKKAEGVTAVGEEIKNKDDPDNYYEEQTEDQIEADLKKAVPVKYDGFDTVQKCYPCEWYRRWALHTPKYFFFGGRPNLKACRRIRKCFFRLIKAKEPMSDEATAAPAPGGKQADSKIAKLVAKEASGKEKLAEPEKLTGDWVRGMENPDDKDPEDKAFNEAAKKYKPQDLKPLTKEQLTAMYEKIEKNYKADTSAKYLLEELSCGRHKTFLEKIEYGVGAFLRYFSKMVIWRKKWRDCLKKQFDVFIGDFWCDPKEIKKWKTCMLKAEPKTERSWIAKILMKAWRAFDDNVLCYNYHVSGGKLRRKREATEDSLKQQGADEQHYNSTQTHSESGRDLQLYDLLDSHLRIKRELSVRQKFTVSTTVATIGAVILISLAVKYGMLMHAYQTGAQVAVVGPGDPYWDHNIYYHHFDANCFYCGSIKGGGCRTCAYTVTVEVWEKLAKNATPEQIASATAKMQEWTISLYTKVTITLSVFGGLFTAFAGLFGYNAVK